MQLLIQIYLWSAVRHSTLLHRNEPTVKDGKPQPKEKLDQNNAQEKRHYSPSTPTTANTYSISLTSHVIPGCNTRM